jgi:hypothetical protein
MVVQSVLDCCGGKSIVTLMDGRSFTAITEVVEKSRIHQRASVTAIETEAGTNILSENFVLGLLPKALKAA